MPEEKRAYPRIKSSLQLLGNIPGKTIDLSESGLSFNSSEKISSPTISLKVSMPRRNFELKTNARIIWNRDIEQGTSNYGVEFIGLDKNQQLLLRKQLIEIQISGLLAEIKSDAVRKQVADFFLKDILEYITDIVNLATAALCQKEYAPDLERKFDHINTQILLKGYCLEELVTDKKIMQKVKENFRHLVGNWIYKSSIVKRAFEKPCGYPGDYRMLEIVYENKPFSKRLGEYFDNNFLKSPYAVAVRIRKDRLREKLVDFINASKLKKIDIFNIACGSCREIKESMPLLKTHSSVSFSCLDWDDEALQFSKKLLTKNAPKNLNFKFIKEDIMNMVKIGDAEEKYRKFDLIYSIGLIDYLPDRVLKTLIKVLYGLLRQNGSLVLTHKNKEKTFPSLPPDWFCDWKFVSRNKEEAVKLFYTCELSEFNFSIDSDDFEYIYYFTLKKL